MLRKNIRWFYQQNGFLFKPASRMLKRGQSAVFRARDGRRRIGAKPAQSGGRNTADLPESF